MIVKRRLQPSFGEGFIHEEASELWEPWMRQADRLLEDEVLLDTVQRQLTTRITKSKTRGRPGTTAEVVLRMLLLKHVRGYSFEELSREVRANLVYREFTRVRGGKVPDDKTMGRLARQIGPDTVKALHERVVALALEHKLVRGRRMRVDTTVVETNVHYPTDSSLLADGVRVLTRLMKKVQSLGADAGCALRDRSRSVRLRALEIARASRSRGEQAQERMRKAYASLVSSAGRVLGQAKRFVREIGSGLKRAGIKASQKAVETLAGELSTMAELVGKVVDQTKARVLGGDTHVKDKVLSVFEPDTEAIRKGKAAKPTEFGKMVKIQEAENQIIVDYEVYAKRPFDSDLLIPSIQTHRRLLGRTPRLVAADAAFYSSANEQEAKKQGVRRFSVPNRSTKSPERWREQRKRSFRRGQKWRTGCEGRISVLKRRHGLSRSRYRKAEGLARWVGFGVIADNLIHIAEHLHRMDTRR